MAMQDSGKQGEKRHLREDGIPKNKAQIPKFNCSCASERAGGSTAAA